jgi:hypothetical protein
MQVLSAYLLETDALAETLVQQRVDVVLAAITQWLRGKGASDPEAVSGQFVSLTADGDGRFTREEQRADRGFIEEIRLDEFSRGGQTFTTRLTTVAWDRRLYIYSTLSVANSSSVVAPIPTDPRCPSIVRTLLALATDWKLNGTPIASAQPRDLIGDEGGRQLATEIQQLGRSLPIIAVSEIEGETLWPRLAEELAYDLAGLARVVRIDDEATWALSDQVGKLHSCYRGAVRLYWPPRRRADGSVHFNSTVWTASALLSNDNDGKGLNRFRSTVRRQLMSIAALTITPPSAIREIQDAVARKHLEDLEARSMPDSEELAIARLYIIENQELKAQLEQLRGDLARVGARADVAEHALGQLKAPEIDRDEAATEAEDEQAPSAGQIRFYKKTHSKSAYDVLVQVADCGHSSWQSSAKADKAKKGLERLLGKDDWKSLQHCGSCTGGGMWKVRW